MADLEQVVESKAPVDVQQAAEKMGWIPPSRFRGDPERFVDADLYIERGETVLPIIRDHNKKLQLELDTLKAESAKTQAILKSAQSSIEQMEERHTVATQRAVDEARRQVKAQLSAASEAGDHDGVAELTDKLTKMNAVAAEPAKPAPAAPPSFVAPPELAAWNSDNPWFGVDKRKTGLALAIAQELRDAGDPGTGRIFYDKITEEVNKVFGDPSPKGDKVEGSRGGAGDDEGRPAGGRKGYSALPADAKQACDAEARRFVGEGKRYKTQADWRSRYAEIYFGG